MCLEVWAQRAVQRLVFLSDLVWIYQEHLPHFTASLSALCFNRIVCLLLIKSQSFLCRCRSKCWRKRFSKPFVVASIQASSVNIFGIFHSNEWAPQTIKLHFDKKFSSQSPLEDVWWQPSVFICWGKLKTRLKASERPSKWTLWWAISLVKLL